MQAVNERGLCFACDTFRMFTTIIKKTTDLTDDEALALAGELQEHILSEIIDRLELSAGACSYGAVQRRAPETN